METICKKERLSDPCFELKNMESSDRYNPFVYIRTEDDIPRLIMNIFKSVEPRMPKKATLSGMMVALFICSLSFISCGLYLYQIKKIFAEAGLKWNLYMLRKL